MTRRVYLGEAIWADGVAESIPPLMEAHGWTYRPEEARVNTRALTFGRGHNGVAQAKAWHTNKLQAVLRKHHWRLPSAMTARTNMGQVGLTVAYEHPVTGWVSLSVQVQSHNRKRVEMSTTFHPILNDLAEMTVTDPWRSLVRTSRTLDFDTPAGVEEQLQSWMAEPVPILPSPPYNDMNARKRLDGLLQLPDLTGLTFKANEVIDTERDGMPVKTYADRHTLLRTKGEATEALVSTEAANALSELGEALKYFEVDFRVITGWSSSRDRKIEGFYLEIPKQPGVPGREERHRLEVKPSGTVVTCGFMEDEARKLEYEKRQAIEFFQGLDEFENIEF